MQVEMYLERLRRGSVSTSVRAQVVLDQAAITVLDAGHMLGHLAADQAMGLLRELNAEGQTMVMVTHDLRLADQAGRIVRLRSGGLDVASPERATA